MGGERERLGLVWLDCSYPVVAAGLKEALEERARVHIGHAAPTDAEGPCCAVFDTSGAESVSEGIERIRGSTPTSPFWSSVCTWICRSPGPPCATEPGISSTPGWNWIR